ncbi:hypothetical protein C8R47DRAFT_103541 [Mycena vitilis]|nr:hypothetical protein C8R47DRAFT_103541 [Mycena vitilis]
MGLRAPSASGRRGVESTTTFLTFRHMGACAQDVRGPRAFSRTPFRVASKPLSDTRSHSSVRAGRSGSARLFESARRHRVPRHQNRFRTQGSIPECAPKARGLRAFSSRRGGIECPAIKTAFGHKVPYQSARLKPAVCAPFRVGAAASSAPPSKSLSDTRSHSSVRAGRMGSARLFESARRHRVPRHQNRFRTQGSIPECAPKARGLRALSSRRSGIECPAIKIAFGHKEP